jgi:hypothetical protein
LKKCPAYAVSYAEGAHVFVLKGFLSGEFGCFGNGSTDDSSFFEFKCG